LKLEREESLQHQPPKKEINYFNENSHLNNNKKRYEQPKGEEPLEHKEKKTFKQLIKGKGSWLNTKRI
jgi:hypothetical protein